MARTYTYVTDSAGAEKAKEHLLRQKVVGSDTETTGLDPHTDKVVLASFACKEHTYVVDTRELDHLRIMAPVLENEDIHKIWHNGIFDYEMIKGSVGAESERNVCLMLGEQTLTVGKQFSGYGLADVTKKYLGIERDKSLQKSFIGHKGPFSSAQLDYSAEDAEYLLDIGAKMQAAAKKEGLLTTWKTENDALQAFGDIEFYGQKINTDAWKKIMSENEEAAATAKVILDRWFEPVCSKVWNLEPGHEGEYLLDMNYDSTPQVLQALQMMNIKVDGKTIANTDKKTQKKIKDLECIRALTAYRSAVKLTGTYGQSYVNGIHPYTRRIHFRFNQYGTGTGRPACRGGLNCLNIPRDKRYRNAFVTDPDRLLSTVDYSAAELRIMAELSRDELMINGFNSGVDFHCFVASMLFGVEVTKKNEHKEKRDPTKTLNFGIAYGMSPFSLYEKLRFELGVKITLEECEDLFDRYFKTFKTAMGWLKSQQKMASSQFVMRNMNGRTRHWFRPNTQGIAEKAKAELTKNGRVQMTAHMQDFELPELIKSKLRGQLSAIEREGANFQIQTVNQDFAKNAMARIRKEFKKLHYDSRMYNFVYDEIVMDSHKSCAVEAHELQKKIMIEEANKMLKLVPMQVEGHLESCWTK